MVVDLAVDTAPGTRSFIRLKQRMNVLLPQPEGPIRAVTSCLPIGKLMSRTAGLEP